MDGFFPNDSIPLVSTARRDWDKILCPGTVESMTCGDQVPDKYWSEFAVTPDTNYYMLMGMFRHNVPHIAVPATLGHLKLNNMEWGIPIAPESREADFVVWGDQYSNFNAGKLIPLIEGIGGFGVSIGNSTFTQVDALPQEWSSMEWRMPIRAASATDTDWVLVKEERFCSGKSNVHTKQITIESNPLDELFLSPWTEGATVLSWTVLVDGQESNVQADENVGQDRLGFRFNSENAKKKIVISIVLQADASADLSGISYITTEAPTSGPSQSPSNGPSLLPSNEVSIFLIFYTLANLLQSFKWYPHTNISPFTLHITANAESKPISFEKSEQGAFSITIGQSDGCPNCISIKSGKLEFVLLFTYCALLYRVYLLTCRIPYHTTIHTRHHTYTHHSSCFFAFISFIP